MGMDNGSTGENYCDFSTVEDNSIKSLAEPGFPTNQYLNIWTADLRQCGADTLLGYSSFPFLVGVGDPANEIQDGVVLDFPCFST